MPEIKKPDITIDDVVKNGLTAEAIKYMFNTRKCPVCDEKLEAVNVISGDTPDTRYTSVNSLGCFKCSIRYDLPKPVIIKQKLCESS